MNNPNPTKKYIYICLLLFSLFWFVFPRTGHPYDNWCWSEWARHSYTMGLGNVYNYFTDYVPLYHYILKFYLLFQGSEEEIAKNIYYLKMITLVFHFITGYFVFKLIRNEKENDDTTLINVLFYLLNIGVLYNAVVWGQVDIILGCLVFISCYYAFKHKIFRSLLFLLLALNFKLHAIIFVPVIGLFILPDLVATFSLKKTIGWIASLAIVQYLIVLPFINAGTMENLIRVVTGSVDKFPVLSANAFNLWHFFFNGDLTKMYDTATAFGLSYKSWGLMFFCATSALALFPQFKVLYLSFKTRMPVYLSLEKILLICSLIPMLFFYFNTQMHERYAHPAFAFLLTYCILQKKPVLAFVASSAYLLNLEAVLKFLQLPKYSTLIFDPDFISCLWLITIIVCYFQLYDLRFRKKVLATG
ncbi:hypothetical protein CNR22_03490 [Sphingobacteriaceae bacterium]|nr:hypothetical protein CNR22_03490 [Sphingobacteriaceae bacterium]